MRLEIVLWAVSLYLTFRFGKGFGKSLVKLPYRWSCYVQSCDFVMQATDANILFQVCADHVMKFHPQEPLDGAISSSEEGSR